jgi:glycosyltransferase involved in cell wall biosynthesis
MDTNNPLLTVVCLTYNHEGYIKNCLDGFLNQITNFNFEVIVHDDASTDKTADIVKSYEVNFPNLFKNIYQTQNQYNNKSLNIWLDIIFPKSQGKYIALCDGDDYWTDNHKLQKQVDFLENNIDFNICYHDVSILNNNLFSNNFIDKTNKNVASIYDLAVWGNFMHTSSVVFKKCSITINSLDKNKVCDFILYMIILNDKKIKKFDEKMSVYRYGVGIWSISSNIEKNKFILDNIYYILNNCEDDTIKEIMQLRLNSYSFYSLPKYLSKFENSLDKSVSFEINEKIPMSILFKTIRKKLINNLKKHFSKRSII